MKVIWTKHAEERQPEWQKRMNITRADVEAVTLNPEQIVPGDMETLIAQSRRGNGLLPIPFMQIGQDRKILTIYWTSKVSKYWKEE